MNVEDRLLTLSWTNVKQLEVMMQFKTYQMSKSLRLLHGHSSISCLVEPSWACLSFVLLFQTDWRRNRVPLASIPAAVVCLAVWPISPRSQVVSLGTWSRSPANNTPINFPSRRNSFSTDFKDAPTSAASDATDTLDARMLRRCLRKKGK